jgi:ribonuclease HI
MRIIIMPQEHDSLLIYTDGGSRGNPGPSAIGVLIFSQGGSLLIEKGEYIGLSTNNKAEYSALIRALHLARRLSQGSITCHSDSQLMVKQLSGSFRVRNPELAELANKVRMLVAGFRSVDYLHVPRGDARIVRADRLVNDALDKAE